jgi:hypothetical protein
MAKKFDFEGARKAGYSDQEISSFLGEQNPHFDVQGAIQAGYSPEEVSVHLSELRQPSRTKSILSAGAKGLRRGAASLNPLGAGPIPEGLAERAFEEKMPSQEKGAEQFIERAGELAPVVATGPEGLVAKGLQLGGGTLAGHLAEKAGFGKIGQGVSEAIGMTGPGLAKAGFKAAKGALTRETEKLPSGLTKLKALEAKNPNRASLESVKQKEAIKKLNTESSGLTQKAVEKNIPIYKEIERGFDFPQHFEQRFGEIQKVAEKANPEIDITPISELLAKNREKYRGIPNLHADAVKVGKEIRGFSNRPQTGLRSLYRIYRSNNQKLKHIYETAFTGGKQKEYADFLVDMNKSIAKSFENTLPKESAWMKSFRDLNKEYSQVQATKKALSELKPLLGGNPSLERLERFANDERTFKKLSMSMGKSGATEIRQIATDLKQSRDAIKRIPVKDLSGFDKAFALAYLIPGLKFIAGAVTAFKAVKGAKYLYGMYLSTPARRRAYQESLRALISRDLPAYMKATAALKNEMEKD